MSVNEQVRAGSKDEDASEQRSRSVTEEGAGRDQRQLLLVPKLQPPRLSTVLVKRERLLARFDEGGAGKLTLVTAPAGFGKTTLVRQWLATLSSRVAVAWVSLSVDDNDLVRFWHYVIAACQRHGLSATDADLLGNEGFFPFGLPAFEERVLVPLLNELVRVEKEGVLILDDYHAISEPWVHETVAFLLEHLPVNMHIILLTRVESPLPLARLRGRDELSEIQVDDLRFSFEETAAFLGSVATALLPEQVELLHIRLEGWPAGLRIVTLALRQRRSTQTIEEYIATLNGGERFWLDYFVTEVLSVQPESVQLFLLQTSILHRLNGPLCAALTGREESKMLLDELAQAHLFLERLDGSVWAEQLAEKGDTSETDLRYEEEGQTWYRYHQLFAEAMQNEARRRLGAKGQRALLRQASWWYEQHNFQMEAVEMALKAEDTERMVTLLAEIVETMFMNRYSELHTLLRWLKRIPLEMMSAYPQLYLAYASALVFCIGPDHLTSELLVRVEQLLERVEQGEEKETLWVDRAFALHALVAYRQGNTKRAEKFAEQALLRLPPQQRKPRAMCLTIKGAGAFYRGLYEQARDAHQESRDLWEAEATPHGVRGNTILLALDSLELGDLHLVVEYLRAQLVSARAAHDSADIGLAQYGLAQISYEWNELDAAERAAQEAYKCGEGLPRGDLWVWAGLMLAKVQRARGEMTAARQCLAALLARLSMPREPLLYREVLAEQIRLLLAMGDLAGAQLAWYSLTSQRQPEFSVEMVLATHLGVGNEEQGVGPTHARELLLLVRLLLAQDRGEEAREVLSRLLATTYMVQHSRIMLEAQVLLIKAGGKELHEAVETLQMVLGRALPGDYLRLFLDEGETILRMLRGLFPYVHNGPLRLYLQSILRAFGPIDIEHGVSGMIEPLSVQELRVLRLLAAGGSNPEIARELVVSVNTVRTQVQSIYRKLNVSNRVEASEMARNLQLL